MIDKRTDTDKAGLVAKSPGEVQAGQTRTTVYNSVRCPAPRNRACQHCGADLAGKRSDAKYCNVNCRNNAFKARVGRLEPVAAVVIIDKTVREALIEAGELNMQDEHSPAKVREAFERAWESFLDQYA